MSQKNDQYYIDLVLNGDINAFGQLVAQYKDMVFTLALRLMKQREEAEEIAQEAFLKAYENLRKFKGNAKFSSWLYRITYNAAMDALKHKKRLIETEEIEEMPVNELEKIDNQLDLLEENERKEIIQQALKRLAEEDSFLLTLYYFEDTSIDEITVVTGLSKSNVKVKLFRARNKLAALLRRKLEPEIIGYYGKQKK